MKLFDLHCDTATEMYKTGSRLCENSLAVSLKKAEKYEKYVQLTAIYTDPALENESGWRRFFDVTEYLNKEAAISGVRVIRTARELEEFDKSADRAAFILTVEDARILNGRLDRVREMYDAGVRLVTPLWGGVTVMGGSHDTREGLSDFAAESIDMMLALGIIPDISHASVRAADEILALAGAHGRAAIASHSASYTVNPHSRNLTDELYARLTRGGGIVGLNLCPKHLSSDPQRASVADVLRHYEHYESLFPAHTALGCDLDGTPVPADIGDLSGVEGIADALRSIGKDEAEIDRLFYKTAYDFMKNNLPSR